MSSTSEDLTKEDHTQYVGHSLTENEEKTPTNSNENSPTINNDLSQLKDNELLSNTAKEVLEELIPDEEMEEEKEISPLGMLLYFWLLLI